LKHLLTYRFWGNLFFLSLLPAWLWAQAGTTPILESRLSIQVSNERMDEVLRQLASKGNFSFSYSPDAIDVRSRVSLNATNQTIREILNVLFDGTVTFRERRRYIILHKAPEVARKQPESFILNGYVLDEATGEKLPQVSIYEPGTLTSTVSNEFGYYRIKLPAQPSQLRLEVRKEEYARKSVAVVARKDMYLSITLVPDTVKPLATPSFRLATRVDTVRPLVEIPVVVVTKTLDTDSIQPIQRKEKQPVSLERSLQKIRDGLVFAFSTASQAIHAENISDTLYRPFQASILPFIGTNHQLSGNVINDVSLNLGVGYSMGVRLFELGGVLNVVRQDVHGLQAAGVANVVGRDVHGVQLAGAVNLVINQFDGFQASGGINLVGEDVLGVQMSPGLNLIGGNLYGAQITSGANIAAGEVYGYQISGGLNYAGIMRRGHQIGFVNAADSSATTPFGFFSYVRQNGYRRLEFTTDEINFGNVTFKTGVRKFYNIFTFGTSAFVPGKPLVSVGYGVGTAANLGRGWVFNVDLTGHRLKVQKKFLKEPWAWQFRLAPAFEKKIGPRLALTVGPTLNLMLSPYSGLLDGTRTGLEPFWIGGKPTGNRDVYAWLGFQAGLRICNRNL
jgi:hypothetical protein